MVEDETAYFQLLARWALTRWSLDGEHPEARLWGAVALVFDGGPLVPIDPDWFLKVYWDALQRWRIAAVQH